MYADCYEWITGELKNVDIPYIEMVNSAGELATVIIQIETLKKMRKADNIC